MNSNQIIVILSAAGDGTLVNVLMKAKKAGADLTKLMCCPLPYGTGNDLARETGWGGRPDKSFYSTVRSLME